MGGGQVIFHGTQSGDELTNIFNQCSVALCSLAGHRKGIYSSSELKSREYLSRGLPMVSSIKIDIIQDGFPFCHYVKADESAIDMMEFISWWKEIYGNAQQQEIVSQIRAFAEECCSMETAMQNVTDYLTTYTSQ